MAVGLTTDPLHLLRLLKDIRRTLGRGTRPHTPRGQSSPVAARVAPAQQYDQDGNPKGPKIEDQAAADAVPRNVTIGFYGPLSICEGTDPAWIEAAEQAYRSDEAAARQQRAIPLSDGDDYGDEFADEEVPF